MHPILEYLAADHDRLDRLLAEATRTSGRIEPEPFAAFRRGLLRHIGIEEKILFSAARKARGEPVRDFARLRADHARLTALLVPTPTEAIVAELFTILGPHNEIEEREGGTYAECVEAIGDEADAILARIRAQPEPPVRPHYDERKPVLLKEDSPSRAVASSLSKRS
jgi:hypothetical protein